MGYSGGHKQDQNDRDWVWERENAKRKAKTAKVRHISCNWGSKIIIIISHPSYVCIQPKQDESVVRVDFGGDAEGQGMRMMM